jgi:glycosyltransferase involved in cell wall biosynthesis
MKLIIITTNYNNEKYIAECVKSLQMQTITDWAQLIIDDCSTDNSKKVIEELADADNRIFYWFNGKRMGSVYNKSVILKKVMKPEDEDVIITLDGDDTFNLGNVLEIIKEAYDKYDAWITYGEYNYEYTPSLPMYGRMFNPMKPFRKQFCYSPVRTYKWFLLKSIPKSQLLDDDGNWFRLAEDWVFMVPMLEMAGRQHISYISDPMYNYRITEHYGFATQAEYGNKVRDTVTRRPSLSLMAKDALINSRCDWND